MKIERRWMWIGGILAVAGLALAVGVPLGTLLVVGALLACPAAMFLGMRGHQGAGGMPQGGGMACCPPGTQPREDQATSSEAGAQSSSEPQSEELVRRT
ncbi:MAG: hypothetical protein ACRDF1_01910 [bacterium]